MTKKKLSTEIAAALQNGDLKFVFGKNNKMLFLKLYILKFRCPDCDKPHEQIFTDRKFAETQATHFPKTKQLPDRTEPQNPHEWSVFPFLARVRKI